MVDCRGSGSDSAGRIYLSWGSEGQPSDPRRAVGKPAKLVPLFSAMGCLFVEPSFRVDPECFRYPARLIAPAVHHWLWDYAAGIASGNCRPCGLADADTGHFARPGLVCPCPLLDLQSAPNME